MITYPELFIYTLDQLKNKELIRVVRLAYNYYGTKAATKNALPCDSRTLDRLLSSKTQPVPDIPGTEVLSFSVENIRGHSLRQIKAHIEHTLVGAVRYLGSNYDLARFFHTDDKRIWRITEKEGVGCPICLRESGLKDLSSADQTR